MVLKPAKKYIIIQVPETHFVKLWNTCSLRKFQHSMDVWSIFCFKSNWTDLKLKILNSDWPQKIVLTAFWKYYFTWHNQNIIWEIFNFLEYFVNMYPSFHKHFLLIWNSWANFLLLLGEIHVFLLFEFISFSVSIIGGYF